MIADTGTQFAHLAPAERVLAAADIHMSGCDAPTVFECAECTRKITKYRKYLAVLAAAGVLVEPGGESHTEPALKVLAAAEAWRDVRLRENAIPDNAPDYHQQYDAAIDDGEDALTELGAAVDEFRASRPSSPTAGGVK